MAEYEGIAHYNAILCRLRDFESTVFYQFYLLLAERTTSTVEEDKVVVNDGVSRKIYKYKDVIER